MISLTKRKAAKARAVAREKRALRRLYWWSFSIRLSAGLLAWVLMHVSNIEFLVDARGYDETAAGIANDWLHGRSSSWLMLHGSEPYQPVGLVTALACFYVITLGVRVLPLPIAMYCAVTSFTPGWTYRIVRELGISSRAGMFSAWLVALCPAFVFWSAALYKEGVILLIINVAFYHALRFQSSGSTQSLTIMALCLVSLLGLRIYLVPLLGLAMLLGIQLRRSFRRSSFSPRAIAKQTCLIATFVILMLGAALGTTLTQDDPFSAAAERRREKQRNAFPTTVADAVRSINLSRRDLASAPSGYLPDVEYHSLGDMIRFLPTGTVCFLSLPLPWQWGTIRQNLALPDTALWVFCIYPLAVIGIWQMFRRDLPATVMLLAAAAAMCCLYAVFIGNIGTAYRMRVQIWLLLVPFVGVGWEILNGRWPFTRTRVGCRVRGTWLKRKGRVTAV